MTGFLATMFFKVRRKITIILSFFAVTVNLPNDVYGDTARHFAGESRTFLSQIDFDGTDKQSDPRARLAAQEFILNEKTSDQITEDSPSSQFKEHKDEGESKEKTVLENDEMPTSTVNQDSILLEAANFITPRLKGPKVDKVSQSQITSDQSWIKKKNKDCSEVRDEVQLKNKSKALKELLVKFSGNSDFYDSQCRETCAKKNQVSVLVGLTIVDANGGSFNMIADRSSGECRYQITKKPEHNWLVLERAQAKCACLPRS